MDTIGGSTYDLEFNGSAVTQTSKEKPVSECGTPVGLPEILLARLLYIKP
jgi:hypothetical protein